ncbi:MAG: hypothetical protein HY840_01145 [Bacteroidetes bacterium]|nr:hypothetical protein [Bacteroidota bacterium]
MGLLLMVFLFFSSCKKKDAEPSNTQKLTSYNWLIATAKIDPALQVNSLESVGSIYDRMEPCYQDDKTKFSSDGAYTVDKSTNKCNGSDQNFSGSWAFQNNESKLYMSNFGNTSTPVTFSVNELSSFVVTLSYPISNTAELTTVLKAYGLDGLLQKATVPSSIPSGTKFILTMRAL